MGASLGRDRRLPLEEGKTTTEKGGTWKCSDGAKDEFSTRVWQAGGVWPARWLRSAGRQSTESGLL